MAGVLFGFLAERGLGGGLETATLQRLHIFHTLLPLVRLLHVVKTQQDSKRSVIYVVRRDVLTFTTVTAVDLLVWGFLYILLYDAESNIQRTCSST